MSSERKKIVYVLGGGRSGTTLCDIILANSEGAFSIGEILKFIKLRGVPHNAKEGDAEWSFYYPIFEKLYADTDESELMILESTARKFEYHSHLLKSFFWTFSKSEEERYKRYINQVFEEIFSKSGADTLIDSSKYPVRALSLSRITDCEIAYLYVKRDPVKVVESFQKKDIEQPSKSVLGALAYYIYVNLACKIVVAKLKRKHRVVELKYEELTGNPIESLTLIKEKLNFDTDYPIKKIKEGIPLTVGQLFEGNRIRLKDSLTISKPPEAKPSFLNSIIRGLTWWIY